MKKPWKIRSRGVRAFGENIGYYSFSLIYVLMDRVRGT